MGRCDRTIIGNGEGDLTRARFAMTLRLRLIAGPEASMTPSRNGTIEMSDFCSTIGTPSRAL